MDTRKTRTTVPGKGDVQEVRTKEKPIGIDDIGLPGGVRQEDVRRPEDVRPDPDKVSNNS